MWWLFICLFTFPSCSSADELFDLPSTEAFFEYLFNATASEVFPLVNSFIFHKVRPQDINFFYFNNNGSHLILKENLKDNSFLNFSSPIKFIIPGWGSTGDEDLVTNMVGAYHTAGFKNVFGVDWSAHSKKEYLHAASSTKDVGKIIAMFITKLTKNETSLLKNVHLIGHSLGAQISGFAGKEIKKMLNTKLGRITGLDAAGPLFEVPVKMPDSSRLTADDAEYVDSFHTNAGFLGFLEPFAKADYYINLGGPIQPGCLNINIFDAFACSHFRSHEIFTESIMSKDLSATFCSNPLSFISNLCLFNRKVTMGEHTTKDVSGTYFINTNAADKSNINDRFNVFQNNNNDNKNGNKKQTKHS